MLHCSLNQNKAEMMLYGYGLHRFQAAYMIKCNKFYFSTCKRIDQNKSWRYGSFAPHYPIVVLLLIDRMCMCRVIPKFSSPWCETKKNVAHI